MWRRILLAWVVIALVAFLLFLGFLMIIPHSHALDRPLGDTRGADSEARLCANPWKSITSSGNSKTKVTSVVLTVTSECRALHVDQVEAFSSALKESIAKWREVLSSSANLGANILYGYSMTVLNDRDTEIDFNLGSWEFAHSPYPRMWEGFSYKIPACSKLEVGFISPNTPEGDDASINLMYRHKGKLTTEGAGRTYIVLPSWPGLHHPGEVRVSRLSSDEIKSEGCKHD